MSSQDILLMDKHMSMLKKCIFCFQAVDLNHWEKIVEKAADCIKSA